MPQINHIAAARQPVKPVPFRQSKGVRIYQGAQRRTMVGSMADICRMLELAEPPKLLA
ncbi:MULTISPECIES: hypothetical protein [Cupriavidus]|uniref:Uncharacterized protein n=1 Tax=Cupriavidus pinatubonensis (strain JMP 134 / LMG 1197) TaxID=264198 RepID=Q46ZR0_CUPPJ|nr:MULTISPECIES: hypothetical protein [Cupriavidus]QYY30208.1 hypothetical protein K2O51_22815 [Cupriavidus pinatubonensis]